MERERMSRPLRRAMIWLALVPVGIILGLVVGEVLPGLLGYGWTHEESLPAGAMALVGIPAYGLFLMPGLVAAWYAWRSRSPGALLWLLPFLIGLLVPLYFLVPLLVSLLQ